MNRIVVTMYIGPYGEEIRSFNLPLDEELLRELSEPVELVENAFHDIYAIALNRPSTCEVRRKKFRMREAIARRLSHALEHALIEAFGINDTERGWRRERG